MQEIGADHILPTNGNYVPEMEEILCLNDKLQIVDVLRGFFFKLIAELKL